MNVNEMHLAVQQGVDKINSLQADMLLSEEIDMELNKAQMKFINIKYGPNNKYGKGFEEHQKRIDDLRSLLREYEAPVHYKEQLNDDIWVDRFRLPSDYMYLVNQRSKIWKNSRCSPVGFTLTESDPVVFFTIDLQTLTNNHTSIPSELNMVADLDNFTVGFSTVTQNIGIQNFNYPSDVENFKDWLLDDTNWNNGFEIYWEQYSDYFLANQFIIVVDPFVHTWVNVDMSTTNAVSLVNDVTALNVMDAQNNILQTEYVQFDDLANDSKRVPVASSDLGTSMVKNKFIQQDDIFTLLDDPFNTTKHTSPLTTIRGNEIDIYTSAIFIIDSMKILYLKRPSQISLSLGIDSELPVHSHQEIIDLAVSSILEGISDPRYKTQELELGKNE